MSSLNSSSLRMLVFSTLFTALIIIGGYINIPLVVPVVLADFFVMLAGLILGMYWGSTSVSFFLFLGLIGLPVFSKGTAGLAILLGPTGGFLFGYLIAVLIIGLISNYKKPSMSKDIIALVIGNILLFTTGIPWFKIVVPGLSWERALQLCFYPFIVGNIIKIVAAVIVIQIFRPIIQEFITANNAKVDDNGITGS